MSSRDRAGRGLPAYPDLKMLIARERVAELRREARRGRPRRSRPPGEPTKRLGRSSRLANGTWLYARRDSS